MGERLKALDRAVYRVERAFVIWSLLVMAAVVFLDVMHRTFADPDSQLGEFLVKALNFCGSGIARGSAVERSIHGLSPFLLGGAFLGLTYFALVSAKRSAPISRRRALGVAVACVATALVLLKAMIWLVPNGFIWSQPFALILILWVGFLGASMCTYEGKHLRVEAVQRFLPGHLKPILGFVSALLTAGFLVFLTYASADYVGFHYREWVDTEYKGGMFQGISVPRWVGFLALPISFTIMAARFAGMAIRALKGEEVHADAVEEIVGDKRAVDESMDRQGREA